MVRHMVINAGLIRQRSLKPFRSLDLRLSSSLRALVLYVVSLPEPPQIRTADVPSIFHPLSSALTR
jgi:hypothetical protein